MERRCYGCMRPKGEEPWCGHCGYPDTKQNKDHQLPVGTVLHGQYLVGRVLGQGGFGITYLGWDQGMETPVAIKEYFPSSQVSRTGGRMVSTGDSRTFQKGKDRFLKEAQTLAKLRWVDNIVQVRSVFLENNTVYIVMEYVDGITLQEHIRRRGGRLSPAETFAILRPVLRTMAQVHSNGMVHRDISPDNIMLKADGTVKLLDFGTARTVVAGKLTHSTRAVLKNGFAPMEQYIPGRSLDQRADEYALCATMYYCMTGNIPTSAVERYAEEAAIPWNQIPGLSAAQIRVLEKGMALKAEDRFADLEQLEGALFSGGTGKQQGKRKRSFAAAAAAALLAAAVAIGGVWVYGNTRNSREEIHMEAEATAAAEETATASQATEPSETVENGPAISGLLPEETPAATDDAEPDAPDQNEASLVIQPQVMDAGLYFSLGLNPDGTVYAAGDNSYGQCNVYSWENIVAVSAGWKYSVGLKSDGTLMTAGDNTKGQRNVSEWKDIIAVSAENSNHGCHTVGLKADGTVVAAGHNNLGQCNVSQWQDIIQVVAGDMCTLGLKSDGTVVAQGFNEFGKLDVSDWTDIIQIAGDGGHTVGLKADGTVVAVGYNGFKQCNLEDWTDIVDIAAGDGYTIGLKADGTVLAAGNNSSGQCNVGEWVDVVDVVVGTGYTLGLKADGTVAATGRNTYGQCELSAWKLRIPDKS